MKMKQNKVKGKEYKTPMATKENDKEMVVSRWIPGHRGWHSSNEGHAWPGQKAAWTKVGTAAPCTTKDVALPTQQTEDAREEPPLSQRAGPCAANKGSVRVG